MKKQPSRPARRRRPRAVRVPTWYYALLAGIFLVGGSLIVASMRQPRFDNGSMTLEGDYPKGADDAPVTMIEWSNFN